MISMQKYKHSTINLDSEASSINLKMAIFKSFWMSPLKPGKRISPSLNEKAEKSSFPPSSYGYLLKYAGTS